MSRKQTVRAMFARIRRPLVMAESPAKRRKISDGDSDEEGGVAVELPQCHGPVVALILPKITPSATPGDEKQAQATAFQISLEQAPPQTIVFRSVEHLRPARRCQKHPKGKGKSLKAPTCRTCAALVDDQASHGSTCDLHYRLPGSCAITALKRWLLNRNTNLDGTTVRREWELSRLLDTSQPDSIALRVAIVFAGNHVRLCHKAIFGLQRYLYREPYGCKYDHHGPIPEAADPSEFPTSASSVAMGYHELRQWLLQMAWEIDYLRLIEEEMREQILNRKWEQAKNGDVYEIAELLRLGFVSKAMVGEYCGLPHV